MITDITFQMRINKKYAVRDLTKLRNSLFSEAVYLTEVANLLGAIDEKIQAGVTFSVEDEINSLEIFKKVARTFKTMTKRTYSTEGITIHEDDKVTSATKFKIWGYYKDNKAKFISFVETRAGAADENISNDDDGIMYYFDSFEEFEKAYAYGFRNNLDFVITNYEAV